MSESEIDDVQTTCAELQQTYDRLVTIIPNETFKKKLETKTKPAVQKWSELYHQEKFKLLSKNVEDEREIVEKAMDKLSTELGLVEEQFKTSGYSEELYERCKVRLNTRIRR
jgi:Zn-dependent M32 family carboxypeptidase